MEANRLAHQRHATESLSRLVSTLFHTREAPSSNIGLETGCSDDSALIQFLTGVRHSTAKQDFHVKVYEGSEVLEIGVDP